MSEQLKAQIKRLEERHTALSVRQSREEMNKILADDFYEIGSSGFMFTKEECLETGVVLTDMTLHHFDLQMLADDIVLTTYFIEDKTRNRNTLRSSIWKYIDERWQLSFHQGTITSLKVNEFKRP
ncbi:nuclear transport factor 2 family protein [Alkalihalobacterium bogoriense]|uniref:nuclear transport factor 2 family protein n=1 Tax=Alkalihalobacterium bogoriense TaxID=246272 RepID=UPI00047BB72B|nr:DUF4440 domain-containing protein [Alkalihalobacterium bogoriense]